MDAAFTDAVSHFCNAAEDQLGFSEPLMQGNEQAADMRRRIRKTVVLLFILAGTMFFGAIVRLWLL